MTITRNGKKINHKQNCRCKGYRCQFISDQELTCRGCLSGIVALVKIALVRGIGIWGVSVILKISAAKA
jgi:hypothetical protein